MNSQMLDDIKAEMHYSSRRKSGSGTTGRGRRLACVWRHFEPVYVSNTGEVTLEMPAVLKEDKWRCTVHGCQALVSNHPKQAYRHLKNCKYLSTVNKSILFRELPASETQTYRQFWDPGTSYPTCSVRMAYAGTCPHANVY